MESRIVFNRKYSEPGFGEIKLMVEYYFTTKPDNQYYKNTYLIKCEIGGLEIADPCLNVRSAEFSGDIEKDSNPETLTEEAAIDLFREEMGI